MFGPDFYPTPSAVASKMLARVSKEAVNFLEPNGGKGDLAEYIRRDRGERYSSHRGAKVDCIESHPELIAILAEKEFPVVGFDWLEYSGVCYYDAIVMNPPFSNGDAHLLKAWDFMHNGEIVCLLNEETIKNPYTAARQRLAAIIAEHGEVEELGACFSTAQRKTDVRVVLVYLRKVAADDRPELWAKVSEEKTHETAADNTDSMLAIRDNLGNMQHYYDMANEHMLQAFEHIRKAALFMAANHTRDDSNYESILALALKNVNSARAEFARKHRRDAWLHVFQQMQFQKWLDKKQRDEFLRDIERDANIPFTADNIKGTLENVISQRKRLFEQSVANVFDELTKYFKGNTNHVEGWKSNDNYKVNRKLVFPYGCNWEEWRGYCLRWNGSQIDIYNDLDRVLCVLSGRSFDDCWTIEKTLSKHFENQVNAAVNKSCESEFFEIRYWKKGTVHLTFKDAYLLEDFNATAAAGKRWLGSNTQKGAA